MREAFSISPIFSTYAIYSLQKGLPVEPEIAPWYIT
jgi:hypothetical protein